MAAALSASAVSKTQLWPHRTMHDHHSHLLIYYSACSRFLQMYVRIGKNYVNLLTYGNVPKTGHKLLDDYIVMLPMASIATYSRAEQFAK